MFRDYSRPIILFFLLTAVVSLTACGVTMNPVKRKPLQIDPLETSLSPSAQTVVVRFEDTVKGWPLAETVWDNVAGAFWDVEESNQIGYTQDYDKLVPAAAVAGFLGGVVGGAIVGASAGDLIETRIVIPFGRLFEGVFQSGLSKALPGSPVCFDDRCESQALATGVSKYVARIQVVEFHVWEQPLNHINLSAYVAVKGYRFDNPAEPVFLYDCRQQLLAQSVGSVFSTSSGFIAEINKISGRFAGMVAKDLITKIQADWGRP